MLTDWITAMESGFCQRLTDQRNQWRAGAVVLIEQAATAQRNVHDLEVTWTHAVAKHIVSVGGLCCVSVKMCAVLVSIAAERQLTGERGLGDARHTSDCFDRLGKEPMRPSIVPETTSGGLYLHGQQPGGVEACGNREQAFQASQQQS